jgi:SNF2 family DNA or RNA helicase
MDPVVLSIDRDDVVALGADLSSRRRARLFFRSVLGGIPVEGGWRCPVRRMSARTLALRVYDWLTAQGYEVSTDELVGLEVNAELERRRSFVRTREAAIALKTEEEGFEWPAVVESLSEVGWQTERELRPHQQTAVAHALTAINAANFSVPGSGKTAVSLAVAAAHLASETIDLLVVVGPLACFQPWEHESTLALGRALRVRRARGSAAQRADLYRSVRRSDVVLLSYATAAADQRMLIDLFSSWRTMLVVDESHRVKRFRGGLWAPALVELSRRARVRMILSGTPMPQSGRDLFSQLNILWPDGQLTGTRDAFATRVDNDFQGVLRDVNPFVSRTPKDALGLPPYRIHRHDVEMHGTQAEIYELIERRFRRRIEDADTWRDKLDALRRGRPIRLLQAATNPGVFNRGDSYFHLPPLRDGAATLMERLANYETRERPAKFDALLTLLEGFIQKGEKAVCWSNFIPNLDALVEFLRDRTEVPVFQIDGRVPAGDDALRDDPVGMGEKPGDIDTRESIIQRFLTQGGSSVLITNPASCSESISLHTTCHNAVYLDRTYDAALFLQSIDRIHRLGMPANAEVNIHILHSTFGGNPTIDHLVDQALLRKETTMGQLLQGSQLAALNLSADPGADSDGDDNDLAALLRYLLGEDERPL